MNNARRKQITVIQAQLESVKNTLEEIASELESVRDDEQAAYDNMPESLQSGDKGDKAQEAIGALENAYSEMESMADTFSEIDGYLETAVE